MSGKIVRRLLALAGALLLVIVMAVVALLLTQPATNASAAPQSSASQPNAATNAQADAQKKAEAAKVNTDSGIGNLKASVFDAAIARAAKLLGLSDTTLKDSLKSGQSLAEVAQAHHVSVQALTDAMTQAVQERVAAAVKAGEVTQAQANELLTGFPDAIQKFITSRPLEGKTGGKDSGGKQVSPAEDRASVLLRTAIDRLNTLLGYGESDLKIAMGNGQSPADQAQAHNLSVQAAKDAMIAAAAACRDAAVNSGEWTQAQADEAWPLFTAQLDNFMNLKADSGSKK